MGRSLLPQNLLVSGTAVCFLGEVMQAPVLTPVSTLGLLSGEQKPLLFPTLPLKFYCCTSNRHSREETEEGRCSGDRNTTQ